MVVKRLLLLSNSTNAGEAYLGYPRTAIRAFLGLDIQTVLFIPFAAVRFSYDAYAEIVREAFGDMGYRVQSIHTCADPVAAVRQAEAIAVGGGNTFHLLAHMYQTDILNIIRERVLSGMPYIGWSAGSNVACPTIKTTNDMPIIEPPSLQALDLVPFQINPHYIDTHPPGYKGETRDERIEEFIAVNPQDTVIGLREGTMLQIEDNHVRLVGEKSVRIFRKDEEAVDTRNIH